ncbi:MAG: PfkB family carbohydrate kinase [Limisphaerales bacterium]
MKFKRFLRITGQYSRLRVAVVGDFCLDRYLEIDPRKREISLETHLSVLNVINVRAQAGAAGTVVNNLASLGVGEIFPVGFCGKDGEGFELRQALASLKGVHLDHFLVTPLRRTCSYCKPLVLEPNQPPRELERLDSKNWTPTPDPVVQALLQSLTALRGKVEVVIAMEHAAVPESGTITSRVRDALKEFLPDTLVIADSRRGLHQFPPVIFKMNAAELGLLACLPDMLNVEQIEKAARQLALKNGRPVIVTMAERGIAGAQPDGSIVRVPALPLRGPIDTVGAGDAVMANAAAALGAGATLSEAMELAAVASSIVIHQLGTTGTASTAQLRELLFPGKHAGSVKQFNDISLTMREEEVLSLLSQGGSNKEIADKAGLSVYTVQSYLKHVYEKMRVRSRTEAVVRYLKMVHRVDEE